MITSIIDYLNKNIISIFVPLLLGAGSIYFFIILKFFPVVHFKKVASSLTQKSEKDGISPLKSLTLALAGTLGVGNIAGVAAAITVGGAGAIFWMCISSLLVTILKYAEIVLAMKTRINIKDGYSGGAMYYLRGKVLPTIFALLCVLSSFAIGNLLQTNSAADAANEVVGIPKWILGVIFACLTYLITSRGIGRAASFCYASVPFMSLLYIAMCLYVIVSNHSALPSAFSSIITDAFNQSSAAGGIFGFIISKSVRCGVARGLITNESGCGTAPIAHASSNCQSPAKQGFLGIFEVLADCILCLFTSVTILITYDNHKSLDGITLVINSFRSSMGYISSILLTIELFMFALATLIGWSCYGKTALSYITRNKKAEKLYYILFAVCAYIGTQVTPDFVFGISDLIFGIMTFINMFALFANSKLIKNETELYFN